MIFKPVPHFAPVIQLLLFLLNQRSINRLKTQSRLFQLIVFPLHDALHRGI
jgi:hypothetical protein